MNSELFLPTNNQALYVIEKSKFLSFCYYVETKEDVQNILKELRRKYLDATHICYAYRLLDKDINNFIDGNLNFTQSYFDDGEPSGTAGAPILRAIEESDLFNCLIVSVRYFGGIKLGANGLTKAYKQSADMCIARTQKILNEVYSICCDYAYVNRIMSFANKYTIIKKDFSEKAYFEIGIKSGDKILEAFNQIAEIKFLGNKYL